MNEDILKSYLEQLEPDTANDLQLIRQTVLANLPDGYQEHFDGKMIHYQVPLNLYPAGYHCTPGKPLPFISLAVQKKHLVLHHLGIYALPEITDWFVNTYKTAIGKAPDMGKGCIRLKKTDSVTLDTIAQLFRKISPSQWIEIYEKNLKK